jgi:hypothetical protein
MAMTQETLDPLAPDDIAFFRLERSHAQGWHYLIFSSTLYLAHMMDWTADVLGYRLPEEPDSPLFVELRLLHLDEDLFTEYPDDPAPPFLPEQEGAGYLPLSPRRLWLVVRLLETLLQESVPAAPSDDSPRLFYPLTRDDLQSLRLHQHFLPKEAHPIIWYRYEPEEAVRSLETLPEGIRVVELPSFAPGKAGAHTMLFTRVYESDLHDPSFELSDSCWGRGMLGFSRAGLRQFVGLLKVYAGCGS